MNIFSTMVQFGQKLLTGMSSVFNLLNTKISELLSDVLPEEAIALVTNVPIVGSIIGYTLIDVLLGVGLPIVIGYAFIKWLIP